MAIVIEEKEHGISIVLDEKFDFSAVGEFRKTYEGMGVVNNKTVTIDFRNTRYIDSSALGMLINAKSFFSSSNSKVALTNTNDQVRKIFKISQFEKKFDIS